MLCSEVENYITTAKGLPFSTQLAILITMKF